MPGIPTSSYQLGTPSWRQRNNQYASPDAAYQRGLESMLGPHAFAQQWGQGGGAAGNPLPYGQTRITSPQVTPVNPISDTLLKMLSGGGMGAAPAAPQQPVLNATQRGFGGAQPGIGVQQPTAAPPQRQPMNVGLPGYVDSMYPPPYMGGGQQPQMGGGMQQPRFQTDPQTGLYQMPQGWGPQPMRAASPQMASPQAGMAPPQSQMRRPVTPQPQQQQPPLQRQSMAQPASHGVPATPDFQQTAQGALNQIFPQLQQGLAGYGQQINLPLDQLSQMANVAGQARADQVGSQFDRDRSNALAQLFQQGRQQQIGMYGDIGNFQVGLMGQQQQEQQNLARTLMNLMLGLGTQGF